MNHFLKRCSELGDLGATDFRGATLKIKIKNFKKSKKKRV